MLCNYIHQKVFNVPSALKTKFTPLIPFLKNDVTLLACCGIREILHWYAYGEAFLTLYKPSVYEVCHLSNLVALEVLPGGLNENEDWSRRIELETKLTTVRKIKRIIQRKEDQVRDGYTDLY